MSKQRTPAQEHYAEKAKICAELKKVADDAVKLAEKQWKADNPQYADQYSIKSSNIAVPKGKKGYSKVYLKIAEQMLWRDNLGKTQKAILENVQKDFSEFNINASVWQKELPKWMIGQIKPLIESNSPVALNIRGCKSLSAIKKRLDTELAKNQAVRNIKADIAISKSTIVVGKLTYPVTMKKSGKYNYPSIRVDVGGKRTWLRVDILEAVLCKK